MSHSDIALLGPIFAAYLMTAIIPGPGMVYLLTVSARLGRKAAFVTALTNVAVVTLRFSVTAIFLHKVAIVLPNSKTILGLVSALIFAHLAIKTIMNSSSNRASQQNIGQASDLKSVIFESASISATSVSGILFSFSSLSLLQAQKMTNSSALILMAIAGICGLSMAWNFTQALLYTTPQLKKFFQQRQTYLSYMVCTAYCFFSIKAIIGALSI